MREKGFFERVVEAMLAVKRFREEVWLRDIALLAEYHVDCSSCVEDENFRLVGGP